MQWAVDQPTGEFLYLLRPAAVTGLSPGQIGVEVPRAPVARTEKYSGSPADPIQAKSSAEVAAGDAARVDQAVDRYLTDRMDDPLVTALLELLVLVPELSQNGTLKLSELRSRLRGRVRTLHRARITTTT